MSTPETLELLRGQLVLLEKRALAALDQVSSLEELQVWKRIYIEGKPPASEGVLFTATYAYKDILAWDVGGPYLWTELEAQAYFDWLAADRDAAEQYSDYYHSKITVTPHGYVVELLAGERA